MFLFKTSARIGAENEATIILDNLNTHNSAIEVLPQQHQLHFLPPYSPFLNPIENVFSAVKAAIKREIAARRVELFQLLETAKLLKQSQASVRRDFLNELIERNLRQVVTPALVQACNLHSCNYLPACLSGQIIVY